MRRGKLIMITLAVIVAGIAAALPYQRAPKSSASPAEPTEAEPTLSLRGTGQPQPGDLMALSLSPTEEFSSAHGKSPAAEFLQSSKQREPMLELPQIRRDEALRSAATSPELAPSFRPFTETIRMLRDVDRQQHAPAQSEPQQVVAAKPLTSPPADLVVEPAPKKPARHHRIVDGDTLESLAERFYDDAQLSHFLYESNRSVLNHPQVLPLGEELKIPPAPASPGPDRAVLGMPRGVSGTPSSGGESLSPQLAPIPEELLDS